MIAARNEHLAEPKIVRQRKFARCENELTRTSLDHNHDNDELPGCNHFTWNKYLPVTIKESDLVPTTLALIQSQWNDVIESICQCGREQVWLDWSSSSSSSPVTDDNLETTEDEIDRRNTLPDQISLLSCPTFSNSCIETQWKQRTSEHLVNETSSNHNNNKLQYQNLKLLALLLSVGLVCFQNAPTCSGLGLAEYNHNLDTPGDNYPRQQYHPYLGHHHHYHQSRYLTSGNVQNWPLSPPRYTRSYKYDPLTGIMSSASGSFSQDPSSTIAPTSDAAPGWGSIFGFGQRPPNSNNNNNNGNIAGGGGGDDFDNHVKRILVPRVSGTPGNIQVREYLVDELKRNDYHIELDEFTSSTPVGQVKFANIIASSNPNACRQLVLACHYDSKMMDGFLGAIDSAVPCAMLLKISDTFSKSFRAPSNDDDSSSSSGSSSADNSLGLQFIFFDGEEAYVQWSHSDSLYGSRHLAAKWAKQAPPRHCTRAKNELERIELFVLLDLIGTSDTSFVMYNQQLKHHYEALQKYEKAHLVKSGLSQTQARRSAAFKGRSMPLDFVEDDHVPFRKRGVSILLLLASPFPRVWHTTADNYEAIDWPKTRRLLHVMEEFVANYPNGSGGGGGT